jgi:glycosyltransferase involved in cell wall biosynthesis
MKKILYVIPRLAEAGTEKHLLLLVKGLDARKFEVHVCCLFATKDKDFATPSGIKLICLNRRSIYDLRIIIDLINLIRREKYDVVHTYLFGFHYLGLLPAKLIGVPLKISSRREIAFWKKTHHCLLENFGNIFADRIIACSHAVADFSRKTEVFSRNKIIVIYNGICTQKFRNIEKSQEIMNEFGISTNNLVIGSVGNLSFVKNHLVLLEAMVLLIREFPYIKCILVGDGHLRREIESAVHRLGLKKNVLLVGRRQDIERILSVFDIFVLSSLSEGLPNALIEAMSCGVPVAASNCGGIPEIIKDGENGILFDPRSPQAIAEAISRLLKDSQLRNTFSVLGRALIERGFNLEKMVREYDLIYSSTK